MKVVHLSTTVSDASANTRLHCALLEEGIDSTILTLEHSATMQNVYDIKRELCDKITSRIRNLIEKVVRKKDAAKEWTSFSYGINGVDFSLNEHIRNADVIHLHWICSELSIKDIQKLLRLGKPIVWTCHDSWAFTGGCHVRHGCSYYESGCGNCRMLQTPSFNDVSSLILKKKYRLWKENNIVFVAPSNWMKESISRSALFGKNRIEVIPNGLDLKIFHPMNDSDIYVKLGCENPSDKINIMFCATDVETPYKGFQYVLELLDELLKTDLSYVEKVVLHVVGAKGASCKGLDRFRCQYWGFVREPEKMAAIYNIADVLIYPSLDDNLPGVVMESLACATPVVSFDTGGISDMVEHKRNGYLARQKDAGELLKGLLWVLENNQNNILGQVAASGVREKYSGTVIARKHIDLYKTLLHGEKDVQSKRSTADI